MLYKWQRRDILHQMEWVALELKQARTYLAGDELAALELRYAGLRDSIDQDDFERGMGEDPRLRAQMQSTFSRLLEGAGQYADVIAARVAVDEDDNFVQKMKAIEKAIEDMVEIVGDADAKRISALAVATRVLQFLSDRHLLGDYEQWCKESGVNLAHLENPGGAS